MQTNREPHPPLDYAGPRTAKTRMVLAPGIIAFLACLFQALWLVFCIYAALAGYVRRGVDPPYGGVFGLLYIGWPTIIAFGCGCYSIYVAGITPRNALGVLAVIISSTLLALAVLQLTAH